MCLSSVECRRVKDKDYFVGYKCVARAIDICGAYTKETFATFRQNFRLGRWHEATGGEIGTISGQYPAGFHIFLKEEDAVDYPTNGICMAEPLVEVHFKDIVAVGFNHVYSNKKNKPTERLCVIAKKMKIVRVLREK